MPIDFTPQIDSSAPTPQIDFTPEPKAPDMSWVQRTAQSNLAANDNHNSSEGGEVNPIQTPQERLNTAAGFPVDKVINGTAAPTDFNAQHREQYIKALNNGSAVNSSDFMQTALHSIVPVAAGMVNRAEHPLDTLKEAGEDVVGALKGGGALLEYPFLSDASKQELMENGTFPPLSDYKDPESPATTELVRRGIELEQSTVGKAMGGIYAPVAALSPVLNPIIESTGGQQPQKGEVPTWRNLIPGFIGVGMDVGGGLGIAHGAGELSAVRAARKTGPMPLAGEGPWDNHPGSEPIVDMVAKKIGKEPDAVTSSDIDQTIAQGSKEIMPAGQDFKDVSTVTGISETALQNVYRDTGKRPDEVFADAQHSPDIVPAIESGKVPEEYQYLVQPREVPPEKLTVKKDDTTRSFSVLDKDGDHVQGGFDSAEEAQHYIDDKRYEAEERKAIEEEGKNESATDKNPAGEQTVIPGTEKISDKELAERKMQEPLRESTAQKPANEGLFDTAGHRQQDLLDNTRSQAKLPKDLSGAKPRYGYGSKQFTLGFDSDIDRALYITAKDTITSKADPRYREFLRNNGFSDADIVKEGQKLKDRIKAIAKNSESGHLAIGEEAKNIIRSSVVTPSEVGKPTSLRSFLSNNGAKFKESGELQSIKRNGEVLKGDDALDHAADIAQQHGYFKERPSINDIQNKISHTNGGREAFRDQDVDRVLKSQQNKVDKLNNDPTKIEHEANNVGIDTEKLKGETDKQYTARLKKALQNFYKNAEGSGVTYRKALGETIKAAEKFIGKLGGDFFENLGEGYIKTFQPELMGDKALRADAYLAKYKAAGQEAENSYYRQSAKQKAVFDKMTSDERMQWLYDHETGRWNEEDDPDHARYQALLDATFKAEKEAIGGDPDKGYKENYLPHAWENPDAVKTFFNSDSMIKKYGKDGFTKASVFQLIQDGIRAGFKLKTDNPESMLTARLLAGQDMIRTMDLVHDMESNGLAKPARAFSVGKRIAKTEQEISVIQEKYKTELQAIKDQASLTDENGKSIGKPVSKRMEIVQRRILDLSSRLDDLNKEKSDNKLSSDQMAQLKNGFRVIGPDNKVWNIHQEAGPLWKNAMEMKGLWENQGFTGEAYRSYMQGKAIWTQVKLGLSLFHPVHVAMINLASGIAGIADHLIQGGKLSDIALKDTGANMGLTSNTFKLQDHPAIKAWKTPLEERTPEQKQMVSRLVEGGMNPIMSARDTIHFKENFDKAINGVGLNNLRLIGTALSLPGTLMKPFFEHWIPGMKAEIYLKRYDDALSRDPSLANDAGKRGEVARQIAKDTDRTYGEMNNETQFWNKNVRDAFNTSFISGGWKIAQIYNARGLLQPGKIAYNWAKTGEFSKSDITYNMLHAYTYTALTLALGGAINKMLGNPIGTANDTVWDIVKNLVAPKTGENNPDGTPMRLNQPAFAKEAYNIAHEITTKGLIGGTGSFLYHQTLMPGIVNTLTNRDFFGHKIITDPIDLHQWMNAGWDTISPISISQYEKAETKHTEVGKVAGMLGFSMAGAYINQTPFEQKIIATYDEQNPPKDSAYQVKLKADLKTAIAQKDTKNQESIEKRMKEEGMTASQISRAKEVFTKPFTEIAWKKLSSEDQKKLIESASPEEKKRFKVKE